MAITQARGFGAFSGGRYGSFADKGAGTHPVGALTQPLAFGAQAGGRYGSFAGREGAHPVGRLTQAYAFGAHSGRRYGSFAGRTGETPPAIIGPPGFRLPLELQNLLAARLIDEDDMLMVIAGAFVSGVLH